MRSRRLFLSLSRLIVVGLFSTAITWPAYCRSEEDPMPASDAAASEQNLPAPHQLVQSITRQVLSDIESYRNDVKTKLNDEDKKARDKAFFAELAKTLSPVIDFDYIAVQVMGQYRNAATEAQRDRFKEAFKEGLVETYGRGLLSYGNQKIVIFPPEEDISGQNRVTVTQEIQGEDANYPLVYSMGLNRKTDEWKVINVIINGINLGSTFRNQFAQAAQKFQGDIDLVIDQWAF